MADTEPLEESSIGPVDSYDTALCIIPPRALWPAVNKLRQQYDKAYEKWPPHINLVYPFVQVKDLSTASDMITAHLKSQRSDRGDHPLRVSLDSTDVFAHHCNNTVFIHSSDEDQTSALGALRGDILKSLGQNSGNHRVHMTIGQSSNPNSPLHKFLLERAGLLPDIGWEIEELSILVRKRAQKDGKTSSAMKLWGAISLNSYSLSRASEASDTLWEGFEELSIPIQRMIAAGHLSEDSALRDCLVPILPTKEEEEQRYRALRLLQDTVLEPDTEIDAGHRRSVLVPVGSYGLNTWISSSDVDCLCIGPISSRTFFALTHQRLRKAAGKGIKILRRVATYGRTTLEVDVRGMRFRLQYCPSAAIAETWPNAMALPTSDPIFTLPPSAVATLNAVRDLFYLQGTVPDLDAFRTAHYLIQTWARRRGLYGARFGYLSNIQISVLLATICKVLGREDEKPSVSTIVLTFFHHYARFDWTNEIAFDPFSQRPMRYHILAREHMVVLNFNQPAINVVESATPSTVQTIVNELERADQTLSEETATWLDFLQGSDQGAADFLKSFKNYIRVSVHFWGSSLPRGIQFVTWLESRLPMLLIDLTRKAPNIYLRFWPDRFIEKEPDEETNYQGCYLIGLSDLETAKGSPTTRDDLRTALASLQQVLQKFEDQIRGDEAHFEATRNWAHASVVRQPELGALRPDHREWGEYASGYDESEDEDDNDEQEAFNDSDNETTSKPKKGTKEIPTRPVYAGKLRSSADVLSRIRWDPKMDSDDFIIGYEDRFDGTMERALDEWKTEQTDEEFIPQHRILYFKRKSDGVVVWDRMARRDSVFGSGVRTVREEVAKDST